MLPKVNARQRKPFALRRAIFALALPSLIAINFGMAAISLARYPPFFSEHGARAFVLKPTCALLVYAVAIVFIVRTHSPHWDSILRVATVFGVGTGVLEVINIGIENGIPFAVRGPLLPIGFMLFVFASWGISGFQIARCLRSIRAGLFAAVLSAGVCMLIAVTVGFMFQFFIAPPEPAYVSTWAEFKRSGWTDAHAFGMANTLDSGFTHLVVAPIVGLFVGSLASFFSQFASPNGR